jgi:hypothetical protein
VVGFQKGQSGNPATQFKPGESGNPSGPAPGYVHLSTRIKKLLGKGVDWEKVPVRGSDKLGKKYGDIGWDAIIYVALGQALSGDAAARKWLSESGFGKNIDVTSDGKALPQPILGGTQKDRTVKAKGGNGGVHINDSDQQDTGANQTN